MASIGSSLAMNSSEVLTVILRSYLSVPGVRLTRVLSPVQFPVALTLIILDDFLMQLVGREGKESNYTFPYSY